MLRTGSALILSCAPLVCGFGAAAASEALPGGQFSSGQYSAEPCVATAAKPGAMLQSAVQEDCSHFLQNGAPKHSPQSKPATTPAAPSYERCYYVPEAGFVPTIYTSGAGGDQSGPVVRTCQSSPTPVDNSMVSAPKVTVPVLIPQAAPTPSLTTLAASAAGNLHLVPPAMHLSPGLDQPQVVNVPTWYFLDPASWVPASSSVSGGGMTVTATATPVSVTWTSGDGGSVTCAGPGTPYPSADPNPPTQSPTCGHAFTRASARFPGGAYPLTAQISWQVGWRASNGASGALPPVTTSATTQVHVAEVQALVTGARS